MQKENLNTFEPILEKILHISLFIYLFALIFPHVTTLRETAFWMAFVCWMMRRFKRKESFIPINPATVSLLIFMLIALIASAFGMTPVEDLNRFKGELLVPVILFLITATEFKSLEKIKGLLTSLVIAFAVYTLLTLLESSQYGLRYFWDKTHREQYYWLDTGYWQRGVIIFPVILGLLLILKNKWLNLSLSALAVTEIAIISVYRSFAVLLGTCSVLLLWALFARPKKYRLYMVGFICLFLVISGSLLYSVKDNPAVSEYRDKLGKLSNIQAELGSEGSFSNRLPFWKAAVDVIKDKPLLGYGWGMKKFQKLVQQEKFLNHWQANEPYVYKLITEYKDVYFPPHNMFIEIAVQSGFLGLAAFACFILIYAVYLVKKILQSSSDMEYNFSVILIGGALLSFMIISLMNNELGNISGKILFAVLGAGMGSRRL
ncbi:MAG: O-antigen ligase family protein [Nitrospirae bacterium]|nr:O-antigen ligase family protein [Nitrospirota bacterium]